MRGFFPSAELLEAHAVIHAKGKQTPNAVDDFPIAAGHWSAHTRGLYHGPGYSPLPTHTIPSASLSGNVYDASTGFYDPNPGWLNPFNANGISDYGHIVPVGNIPSNTFTTIGEGTITQGFDPSSSPSHDPYFYGHSQPMPAAPLSTHAVTQASNLANATRHAQPGVMCVQCGTHVGRQSDLGRHMKTHDPNAQVFRCQVQGCQYSSKRKDKLIEHSRRPH